MAIITKISIFGDYLVNPEHVLKFIFREREREREREGKKYHCVVAPHTLPTGDLACNPVMCPDWESNQ